MVIVAIYLALNAVVVIKGLSVMASHPELLPGWTNGSVCVSTGRPADDDRRCPDRISETRARAVGIRDRGRRDAARERRSEDTEDRPIGRIRNTKKLLLVAALIMSVLLMVSSVVTTVLIPGDLLHARRARRLDARWRTWRMSISALYSARFTTSRRSGCYGSLAHRRWQGC